MSKRCVFVQYTARPSGSPLSGLMVVRALRGAGYEVHAVFHELGELVALYESNGCVVTQLSHGQWLGGGPWHRRLRRLVRDLAAASRFAHCFRKLGPQLVYVNNLTGLAPVMAAKRLGIPCVWHLRELLDDVGGEMHAPWPGGKRLIRRLVRCLPSHIVVISRAVAENVVGSTDWPRLTILPNAVGDEFFDCPLSRSEARARLGLPRDVPLVGVPGTLRPVKGHRFFLEAFARLAQAIPAAVAAITGDGESRYRSELIQLVHQLGLANRVLFLGTVADMPAFYRACDVICVPSRSESFGRAVIEAFAVGTPVLATSVGGMRETIEHEKTGLLVQYGNAEELSTVLFRPLADRPLALRLAHAAQHEASNSYRESVYQERICRVVDNHIR